MARFEGTLEYLVKKEKGQKKKRVTVKKKSYYSDKEYDSYEYLTEEFYYDKAVWRIRGAQPAIMTSRIVPDAWSNEAATVEVHDNAANIEHINWIMMRFNLEVKTPEIWGQRKAALEQRIKKREGIENLQRIAVSAAFTGAELFDFQKEGLDFLKKLDGNCLLADEQGLGKTIEALAYIADEGEPAFPVLIVAPVVALRNWRKHIARHVRVKRHDNPSGEFTEPTIHLIEDGTPGKLPLTDFYIVNYDNRALSIFYRLCKEQRVYR